MSAFFLQKIGTFTQSKFYDHSSGIRLSDGCKLAINRKKDNDVKICRYEVIVNFSDAAVFFLSRLVTGPSFMSMSWLVLKLWQFSFIKNWPEVRKSKIPPSEFCPISRDWGKLRIPNLAQMSLIKCYWMLENARVTAFTVSEPLRENQQGGGGRGRGVRLHNPD